MYMYAHMLSMITYVKMHKFEGSTSAPKSKESRSEILA